jgi:hypothetical protein
MNQQNYTRTNGLTAMFATLVPLFGYLHLCRSPATVDCLSPLMEANPILTPTALTLPSQATAAVIHFKVMWRHPL